MAFRWLSQRAGLASDSLLFASVRVLTTLSGILTTSILSHGLSVATYGVYSQGNLIISLGASFSILGFTDGVNFFYNKTDDAEKKRQYINTLFGIQLVIGGLLACSIFAFQDFLYAYFKSDAIRPFIIYLCFRPLLNNFLPMLQVLYVSNGRAKQIAIRNVLVSLIKLAAVCITVFYTQNIGTIFGILLLTDAVSVIYFALDLSRQGIPIHPWKIQISKVKEILQFCIPMGIYVLVNSLCRECDKLVVARMGGSESLAVYTNCSTALPIDLIISAVLTVMVPTLTRLYHHKRYGKAAKTLGDYLTIGYLSTLCLGGACILLSKEIIQILYGESYLIGWSVFVIYVLVDMIKFANITAVASIAGKTKFLMHLSAILLAANIVLNVMGYCTIGLIGPAMATLIVTTISIVALQRMSLRELHCNSIRTIFDTKRFFTSISAALIWGMVLFTVKRSFFAETNIWITLILFGGLYCGGIFLFVYKKLKSTFISINHMEE